MLWGVRRVWGILQNFFWGGRVGTDKMPSRSDSGHYRSTVFDVTKPAFRAQILRDVPPKVAIFDTCWSCVKRYWKYNLFRTWNVFGLESCENPCPIIKPLSKSDSFSVILERQNFFAKDYCTVKEGNNKKNVLFTIFFTNITLGRMFFRTRLPKEKFCHSSFNVQTMAVSGQVHLEKKM